MESNEFGVRRKPPPQPQPDDAFKKVKRAMENSGIGLKKSKIKKAVRTNQKNQKNPHKKRSNKFSYKQKLEMRKYVQKKRDHFFGKLFKSSLMK